MPRVLDREFANLESIKWHNPKHLQVVEANFDAGRFLAKYFGGPGAARNPRKTPEPVELVDVSAQLRPLLEASAASIPGLHLCGEGDGRGASAFIGWGAANVEAKARAAKDARDRKLAEDLEREEAKERAWEEEKRALREKPHKDFMTTYKPTPGPLTLDDLVGRWEVKDSEPLLQPYFDDQMFMEITKPTSVHGAAGRFSFGIVEGALLLAMSEDSLHKLKDELEDPEDDGEEADGYGCCGVPVGKRKVHQGAGWPPIKRRLGEAPKPNRVHFFWTGGQPDGDYVTTNPGEEHSHCGHLDFDPCKATAKGVGYIPSFYGDQALQLEIAKVSSSPTRAKPASRFSDMCHDDDASEDWKNTLKQVRRWM